MKESSSLDVSGRSFNFKKVVDIKLSRKSVDRHRVYFNVVDFFFFNVVKPSSLSSVDDIMEKSFRFHVYIDFTAKNSRNEKLQNTIFGENIDHKSLLIRNITQKLAAAGYMANFLPYC